MNDSWKRLKSAGYRTRLYRYTLERRNSDGLVFLPQNPWPGDPSRANDLFRGQYRFLGREASAPNQPPWRLRPDDEDWSSELHSFEWLRHFEATGGEAASSQAQRLVRSWIDLCSDIDPTIWSPGVLGRRLIAFLSHGKFLIRQSKFGFETPFINSVHRQWRHLQRTADDAPFGAPQLFAAVGLVYGAISLSGGDKLIEKYLHRVEELATRLKFRGGGCYSRSPSDLKGMLELFLALREAVLERGFEVPRWLQETISLMASSLLELRHGDGGLALFNGGLEDRTENLDRMLKKADAENKKELLNANSSGYQRLTAGETILIVESSAPPAGQFGLAAHSGGTAFEMSAGQHRLVVNCGSGRYRGNDWSNAARTTAAHSTLHFADANAWQIHANGGFGPNPAPLYCQRHEDDSGSSWLELQHEGYRKRFGLIHHRRIYLNGSGLDVRGEDRLEQVAPEGGKVSDKIAGGAVIRFHLHPNVRASVLHGGQAVLLRLADGKGWRFRANTAQVTMQDSIYLGQVDRVRRSQQILLTSESNPGDTVIKWAFQQV